MDKAKGLVIEVAAGQVLTSPYGREKVTRVALAGDRLTFWTVKLRQSGKPSTRKSAVAIYTEGSAMAYFCGWSLMPKQGVAR